MSTLIRGEVFSSEDSILFLFEKSNNFNFNIIDVCVKNKFGLYFNDRPAEEREFLKNKIVFSISDNFLISNCEKFMEPIYYPEDSNPTYEKLRSDIKKLKQLMSTILAYDFIDRVELFISFVEVNLDEYKCLEIKLDTFEQVVFDEYLRCDDVPVIRLVVKR